MKKSGIIAGSLAAAGLVYIGVQYGPAAITAPAQAAPTPASVVMPVPVTAVVRKTLPIYLDYTGRIEAISHVVLQAKISGYVAELPVADGSDVQKDDLLYRIDPRDYKAALESAQAQVQRDDAALDFAKSNLARGTKLVKSGSFSKEIYDQRLSDLKQAQATKAVNEAALRQAEINLSYTEIRAPFAGRLGRNQASAGSLIGGAGAALNTLAQLDPIYVTFNPTEVELRQLQSSMSKADVNAEATVPGDSEAGHTGRLSFLDNGIDQTTGTIMARAIIRNAGHTLLPGQYVHVRVQVGQDLNALLVPQTAVGSNQFGKFIFVVGKDNKAEQRVVALGATDGTKVAVLTGVGETDRVITGNLQKIGPGAAIDPKAE